MTICNIMRDLHLTLFKLNDKIFLFAVPLIKNKQKTIGYKNNQFK